MQLPSKVSGLIRPRSKSGSTLQKIVIAIVVILGITLWYQHHKPTYSSLGYINVFPEHAVSKNYRLKVGDINEFYKNDGATDTIGAVSVTSHWYSFSQHYEYIVDSASWPNGGKLTLSDYVVDQKNHKAYSIGPGCTIPSKIARAYCIGNDGRGYYVELASLGTNISAIVNNSGN